MLRTLYTMAAVMIVAMTARAQQQELVETAVIPLKSLQYAEVQPMLEGMLSPEGEIGFFAKQNKVIVHDYPSRIKKIKAFLEQVDEPAANIRLQVEFLNDGVKKRRNLRVTADGGQPKLVIRDGRVKAPDEWEVSANDSRVETQEDTTQFLMARSGHPARLWVGETIREPALLESYHLTAWNPLGGVVVRQAEASFELVKEDIGASMWMLATYQGDGLVDIRIFPVVTMKDKDGKPHHFRVQEIETRVLAQHGERTFIGGVDKANSEFLRQLLGPDVYSKEDASSAMSMYVTPTVRLMDRKVPVDRASETPDNYRPTRRR